MKRRLRQGLFQTSTEVKIKVNLTRGLEGGPLPLRIKRTDMVFVLKVKVEIALRLLRESTQASSSSATPLPTAEDVELEFRGVALRDMMTIDRYGIESGMELVASYVPQPPERALVPRQRDFVNLEDLILAEDIVPSTGTLRRIISRQGKLCQVCWRQRWFRAQVLQIYSTSLLLAWHDWPDAAWPHFFIRVCLSIAPNTPPPPEDETWRVRWHTRTPSRELPVVMPRFGELPPLNWVKAFLRTYAASDEMQLLREIQATLPRELLAGRHLAAQRHRCLLLGAPCVGKSTLAAAVSAGPPAMETVAAYGAAAQDDALGLGLGGGPTVQQYWPTVGTRCFECSVSTPGLGPMALEVFDTSGNARFKPLSLVFYRQAQSVVLVFDVKSMASFRAIGEVGGWLHEFTRLTGHSPSTFPFVLVGNKAEDDVAHHRQVFEEDVREWMQRLGARMPYLETSFGGDELTSWRHAERIFRSIARMLYRAKENLGRYLPPETVRVPEEPDHAEEEGEANLAAGLRSFTRILGPANGGLAEALAPLAAWVDRTGSDMRRSLKAASNGLEALGESVHERLPGGKAERAKHADCFRLPGRGGGGAVVTDPHPEPRGQQRRGSTTNSVLATAASRAEPNASGSHALVPAGELGA